MNSLARTIIMGLMAIFFLGVFGVEFYLLSNTEAQIAKATEGADTRIGSDSRARSILSLQQSSKEELEVVEGAILDRSDLADLLENLQKTGVDMGLLVTISSVSGDPGKTPTPGSPETVRVSLEARGTWESGLAFMRLIENLPYKLAVEKAGLMVDDGKWNASVTLRLTTYSEK